MVNALYVGRRLNGGHVSQAFKLPDEKLVAFKGIHGVFIGGTYLYNDEKRTMSSKPERVDAPVVHNAEWEAADAAAEGHLARVREDARLKKCSRPAIRRAVETLRPLLKGSDYYAKRALIEFLIVEAGKK